MALRRPSGSLALAKAYSTEKSSCHVSTSPGIQRHIVSASKSICSPSVSLQASDKAQAVAAVAMIEFIGGEAVPFALFVMKSPLVKYVLHHGRRSDQFGELSGRLLLLGNAR